MNFLISFLAVVGAISLITSTIVALLGWANILGVEEYDDEDAPSESPWERR